MRRTSALTVVAAVLVGACGGGDSGSERRTSATQAPDRSAALGVGVDDDSIRIGITLVDFECIKDFVDEIRVDQDDVYQVFVDEVNDTGGIHGRRLEPVFYTYCPIPGSEPSTLTICTRATEDDRVFAILGIFVDFSGDAQTCVTRDQERILITHLLTQQWIDEAPPALLLTPDVTAERRLEMTLDLLQSEGTLDGEKVAVLAEANSAARIESTVDPALEAMDVTRGSDGLLSITGTDTSAAQSQLDAFIERWRSENVGALVLLGQTTAAKQFVEKIRAELPDLLLIVDNGSWLSQAQDYVATGAAENPYEGVITTVGEIGEEHASGEERQRCDAIYERRTGSEVPGPNDIVEGPGGKRIDVYTTVGDACVELTMFVEIATAVGPELNNENWRRTVDSMGSIPLPSRRHASLGPGKYDADDSARLVTFDPGVGEEGDWRAITPIRDAASL